MTSNTTLKSEEDNENKDEALPKFNLSIHALIESSQSQHGLRHSDYTQYRSYCTRRLSRLRHSKQFRTELSKITVTESKGSANKGARHAFKPSPYYRDDSLASQIAMKNENFMLVELFSAERSWCHALELKADYDNLKSSVGGNNKKKGSRGHFMQRLKRAVQFANRLQVMTESAADERTIVEAKAYATWMIGNLSLEKSDYQSAYVNYGTAHAICLELAQGYSKVTGSSDDDKTSLEMRDYFLARAENSIEPLLKFCLFELKDGGMSENDIAELVKNLQIENPNESKEDIENTTPNSSTSTICFRGQTVPITNQSLLVALLKLDTLVTTYKKNNQNKTKDPKKLKKQELAFLDLLSGYDDVNAIVYKEYKEYDGMKSGPAVDAKKRELETISGYLKYEKLKLMMERNEKMANELRSSSSSQKDEKLDEIAHLYDALLQDARTVASLPGGPSEIDDNGVLVPIEDDFLLEANAHILRFRALRCYYIGRMYDSQQKYKEAMALMDHALNLTHEAVEEINACATESNQFDVLIESMVNFENDINGAKCRAQAYAYLARIGKLPLSSSDSTKSILNRLEDFNGGEDKGGVLKYHLAEVPPRLRYIPCKPAFFDIALNFFGELPETQAITNEYGAQKSSGLLSWFMRG